MSEKRPKYMNWILECINLLRSRKSRPDLERICRTMHKCHGIDEKDTEEDLAALVAAGVVTKRSFKGAISYRNASGWNRAGGPGKVSRAGRWVSEAIREIDHGHGVTLHEIESYVSAKHPFYNNLKPRIKIALKDDLDSGRIWSPVEGRYRLLEAAEESPEREIVPTSDPLCDFCLQTSQRNRRGEPENLLICRDCGNKAHPSCMNYSPELTARIRADSSAWQCIDCKACIICNDSGDAGSLLFCDACDKGYHMQCHVPPLETMPIGKWICYNCKNHPTNPVRMDTANGIVEVNREYQGGPWGLDYSGKISGGSAVTGEGSAPVDDEILGEVEVKDMNIQVDAESVQRELELLTGLIQSTPPRTPPLDFLMRDHKEAGACRHVSSQSSIVLAPKSMSTVNVGSRQMRAVTASVPQTSVAINGTATTGDSHKIDSSLSTTDADINMNTKPAEKPTPDATNWLVADVVSFLNSLGFGEEAKSFEDQEIDGRALLLMSRTDVLTGMSLKLGPALKIYGHVSRLQSQAPVA